MRKKVTGILPGPGWLRANGYGALVSAMKHSPQAFKHIQQMVEDRKSPAEWFAVAVRLERKYGHVPCSRWLNAHGYSGLYNAIRLHRPLFASVKLETRRRTKKDWRVIVVDIVKKMGTVPCTKWLETHGYGALAQAIYRFPDLLKGTKQDYHGGTKLAEWVQIARRLEKQLGAVPRSGWLKRHDYRNLDVIMAKYPNAFRGVKKAQRQWRTPAEWVPVLKDLIRKYGKRPTLSWLKANGFRAMVAAMYRQPKLFQHLKP